MHDVSLDIRCVESVYPDPKYPYRVFIEYYFEHAESQLFPCRSHFGVWNQYLEYELTDMFGPKRNDSDNGEGLWQRFSRDPLILEFKNRSDALLVVLQYKQVRLLTIHHLFREQVFGSIIK